MNDLQAAQDEIQRLRRDLAECEKEIALGGLRIAGGAMKKHGSATPRSAFLERVRLAVANALVRGRPTIRAIARALHASPRTLQRRLREQGTSYAKLIDSVRRERTESLVTTGRLSITEIAFLAGFRDLGGFRRAFRRWTGVTPSRARAGGGRRGPPPAR
jgi:AraC-like DNA-binding protein